MNEIKCKKCGGSVKESKGYGNAYSLNGDDTRTILQGKGDLIDCLKCVECGHSFVK